VSTLAAQRAESLLEDFGISTREDIDVEAIALDSGLQVIYEPLVSCGATLVGSDDKAIATVHSSANRARERFFAAHELGHWLLHRGQSFQCRMQDADSNLASGQSLEAEADAFAMHLLMPDSILRPLVQNIERPDFAQIRELAKRFEATLAATLLRLASLESASVIVASYHRRRLRWSVSAPSVPFVLRPKKHLDEATFTHDLLFSGKECNCLGMNAASSWFEDEDSEEYIVWEQCFPNGAGQALVLLYPEPAMLKPSASRSHRCNPSHDGRGRCSLSGGC
jgi:hypothetical protein